MLATRAPDAVGHRDAVAGRDVGVRGVEVDLAGAAGGEHRRRARRRSCTSPVALVEHVGAEARRWGRRTWRRSADRPPCGRASSVMFGRRAARRASSARSISRPVVSLAWTMRRAVWPPSRPRSSCAVGVAVEARRRSSSTSSRIALRALAHAQLDDVAVAQPVADGAACPATWASKRVVGVEHRGDAALRVVGVASSAARLVDDDDAAVLGGAQREVQAGDARNR